MCAIVVRDVLLCGRSGRHQLRRYQLCCWYQTVPDPRSISVATRPTSTRSMSSTTFRWFHEPGIMYSRYISLLNTTFPVEAFLLRFLM